MSRHEKRPVKLAHLMLVAAWSDKASGGATPEQAEQLFSCTKPGTQRILERFAAVTERRYGIGRDIGYLNEIGVFFLIVLAALFVTLLFTHWQSAVFLMVGAVLGFLLSAASFVWAERRPFTMDDLP